MCSQNEVRILVQQMVQRLTSVFPGEKPEAILFGSYARNNADDGSDFDVLFLVNAPRNEIAEKHWRIGEAATELLLDSGVVVSPIVENRAYYQANAQLLPLFRHIELEGVRISF